MKLVATLSCATISIPDLPCEIELPLVHSGVVPLRATVDSSDWRLHKLDSVFSLFAELSDLDGKKHGEVRAQKIHSGGVSSEHYAPKAGSHTLHAEAVDLCVTTLVEPDLGPDAGDSTTFYLTPSGLLAPACGLETHYKDGAKFAWNDGKVFDLDGMASVRTEMNLVYHKDKPEYLFAASKHLVAIADRPALPTLDLRLACIDQFLVLVSFAERRRCMCYRYTSLTRSGTEAHYRGSRTVPEIKDNASRNDTLIDASHFDEFVRIAYPKYTTSPYGKYLRDAMAKLGNDAYRTFENEYIAYFAGLENLLNAYRDISGVGEILPDDEWRQFEKDLRTYVKSHSSFKVHKDRRAALYDKLGELNRISLGRLLKSFTTEHGVDLNGLWPVCEPVSGGVNLYQIRNHIVHGRVLPQTSGGGVFAAAWHMRWVLERCVLALLGADLAKSRANPDWVGRTTVQNWLEASQLLRVAWEEPADAPLPPAPTAQREPKSPPPAPPDSDSSVPSQPVAPSSASLLSDSPAPRFANRDQPY